MEPIIALATPPLKAALALIRLSGDGVFEIVAKTMKSDANQFGQKRIHVGKLYNDEEMIDEVVAFCFKGPNSFTGEDVVELSCHGSMIIAQEILTLFYSLGVRQATRGEFSARAFYNGKVDLIEAEAINDLINASTKEAKNLALLSLSGKVSSLLTPTLGEINEMLAQIEVNIDYPEYEDIEEANLSSVGIKCAEIEERINTLIKEGDEGRIVREGISIAIVGEPNAGKSSLLNAFLNEEKAIVTEIPGTTRDVVEGTVSISGIPLRFLDTAGIRESDDFVEKLGVKKSVEAIEKADLILLVVDSTKEENDGNIEKLLQGKRYIKIYNKSDLLQGKRENNQIYISAKNSEIEDLKKEIISVLGVSEDAYTRPSFSNTRELGLLRKIGQSLKEAREDCEKGLTSDLVSAVLQEARLYAQELLGEDVSMDLSDEIFSRFCVGK